MALRRRLFGSEIAAVELVFQPAKGAKRRVRIRLGKPYQASSRDWACPSEMRGFEPRYPDARGASSWQALTLAIFLLRSRIDDFVETGGTILTGADGSTWDKRALTSTFGPPTALPRGRRAHRP